MTTTEARTDITPTALEVKKSTQISYKASARQWLCSEPQAKAEQRVLEHLPFYPESDGKRTARTLNVPIGRGLHLHEFEITNVEPATSKSELVVLHGYAAALVLFFQNFEAWSSIPGITVHALDMLGFGLSSRPKFLIPTKDLSTRTADGRFKAVEETENWFIDALEQWRIAKKIDKFMLMGHSMGGYIAAAYAIKYPERVEKLILVSPAGVGLGYGPELEKKKLRGRTKVHLPMFNSRKKPAEQSRPEEELMVDQAETTGAVEHSGDRSSSDGAVEHSGDRSSSDGADSNSLSDPKDDDTVANFVLYLWNNHMSPFSILRWSGFLGPRMVSNWTSRRFSELPASAHEALHIYSYQNLRGRGSGEYGLTRLFAFGVLAREPLVSRVEHIKCPSLWVYGEKDWMDVDAGKQVVRALGEKSDAISKNAQLEIVSEAGHHVYLDNPTEFDEMLVPYLQAS